jgi:putative ABC transport system ATP-binding protein
MILCESICKTYGKTDSSVFVKALEDINLNIEDGEFVSIIGKSGAGKSTLLKILGTILRPSEGRLIIDGLDVTKMKPGDLSEFRNKHIGFIYQSFMLEESLTAIENVALPLMISGLKKKEYVAKALDMLRMVGLEQRSGHKPSELSGGERQRVCIARALINDPSIILADEPTGNLDEKTGKEIMDNILRMSKGKTLILVTHDMDLAAMAPRKLVLHDGKLV